MFKITFNLHLVTHYMDELDLLNLFTKYVPAAAGSLADHAESLCILTANIICDNKPLYKVQDWLRKYSDGFDGEPIEASLFNNGGSFITTVPKGRKDVKQFIEHLRNKDVQWQDAFKIESSRKKGKIKIYRTYEPKRTNNGFRIIFVHINSKQEDDGKRRRKKKGGISQLEELAPKLTRII